MALIRMCVVQNCSKRLSWPILWIVTACATYWTRTAAVCVFNGSLNQYLASHPSTPPSHPPHHPTPTHPPPYTRHL